MKLKDKTRLFVTPVGVGQRLIAWGINDSKVIELDWWQETKINNSITLAATPAQHFSGRSLWDHNKTLWASWVIFNDNHRLYFSGDSGMFAGFNEIGNRYGPFDFTFMHIGAYAKEWAPMHMNPEEAIAAHYMLQGKVFVPIHWGTFRLAFHPWKEPAERLYQAALKHQLRFVIPIAGQSIDSQNLPKVKTWWREIQ